MSYIAHRMTLWYARWREAFLRAHPEKRLFPEYPEDTATSDRGFISLGEKGKKIGGLVALVAIALLLSGSD